MNEIQIFDNPKFGSVRALEIDGEPWFVGKDAAGALGYSNPRDALQKNVDADDVAKHDVMDSRGRTQEMTIINESGLYSLIFSSKLPKAKEFKRWVTSEVLPSIRKTGSYVINHCSKPPERTGEVARYISVLGRYMEKQGSPAFEIVRMIEQVSLQHGIYLPDNVVKPNPFQTALYPAPQ